MNHKSNLCNEFLAAVIRRVREAGYEIRDIDPVFGLSGMPTMLWLDDASILVDGRTAQVFNNTGETPERRGVAQLDALIADLGPKP
jgi:hypothetical protein